MKKQTLLLSLFGGSHAQNAAACPKIVLNFLIALLISGLTTGSMSGCTGLGITLKTAPADRPGPQVWPTNDLRPNHLALAEKLVKDGYYDVALVQLGLATRVPGNARVYDLSGVCARETGDFRAAKDWFEKALKVNDQDASVHGNMGILFGMTNDFKTALVHLEKAAALDPGRADFLNNLGWAAMVQQEYPKARKAFEKALALEPENTTAANNLAMCLGMQGDHALALALLLNHQSDIDARHNLDVIRAMALKRHDHFPAFDIQKKNNPQPIRENSAPRLSGKAARSIQKKYENALKK